jgi:hypothetical protein
MKFIHKYCLLFAIIFTSIMLLEGCSKNVSKLQGKWSAAGSLGDSTDMHSWYIEYEFDGRSYKMSGYPPISEEGSYEIVEEKGDSLQLYFNVTKSSPEIKSHKEWLLVKDSSISIGSLTLRKTTK